MKKGNSKICQRCKDSFECKANDIENCQCASVTLTSKTQQYLSTTSYNCLCKKCLVEINQKIEKEIKSH